MDEEQEKFELAPPEFMKFTTWNLIDRRGPQKILRILLDDGAYIYYVKVAELENGKVKILTPSGKASSRLMMKRDEALRVYQDKRFFEISDDFIPKYLKNGTFNEAVGRPGQPSLGDKRKVIKFFLDNWGDIAIFSPKVYAHGIQECVKEFKFSDVSIRRWIEKYWYYGGHENALVIHHMNMGAPGVARRGILDPKTGKIVADMGRPPAGKHINRPDAIPIKRFHPKHYEMVENFIRERIKDKPYEPCSKVFHAVLTECLVASNQYGDYPIKEDKLPSRERLRNIVTEIWNRLRAEITLETGIVPGARYQLAGGSSLDLVEVQLPTWDIDATVADVFILYAVKDVATENVVQFGAVLKPTVVMVVDRESNAIVGFCVTYDAENTASYLDCIQVAISDKEWLLDFWEVSELKKGFVTGQPHFIMFDRGAGVSLKAQSTVTEALHVRTGITAPRDAPGKGTVENVMGKFQAFIEKILDSCYHKTKNPEYTRQKKLWAKKNAVTEKVFMQALLECICDWNMSAKIEHNLTPELMASNTLGTPINIFNARLKEYRGDARVNRPRDTVFRMFAIAHTLPAPEGIVTLGKNLHYSSKNLRKFANAHALVSGGKSPEVTIYEVPNTTAYVQWDSSNGNLERLEPTTTTRRGFSLTSKWLTDYETSLRRHLGSKGQQQGAQHRDKQNRAVISKKKEKEHSDVDSRSSMPDFKPMPPKDARAAASAALKKKTVDAMLGAGKKNQTNSGTESTEIDWDLVNPEEFSGYKSE